MPTYCECELCQKIKDKHEPKPKMSFFPVGIKELLEENPYKLKDKLEENSTYFVDVANGKYSVYLDSQSSLKALRYGEPWRDLCGDNLIYNLMVELIEAKEIIQKCKDQFQCYCAMDGDNVATSIREILKGE